MFSWAPLQRAVRLVLVLGLISSITYIAFHSGPPKGAKDALLRTYNSVRPSKPDVTLVAASIRAEDTSWVVEAFPEWAMTIYVTDDPKSPFAIPGNRGHEVMVYLSYIIDHFDDLTPVTIFHHAIRYQWHTDDPAFDGLRQLRRLKLDYVKEAGYANLRCAWEPGCPRAYPVYADEQKRILDMGPTNEHWPKLYQYIYNETVPEIAGQGCCAEFAVADWQIRATGKEKFILARRWLVETYLIDDLSGRLMEYMWHSKSFVHGSFQC